MLAAALEPWVDERRGEVVFNRTTPNKSVAGGRDSALDTALSELRQVQHVAMALHTLGEGHCFSVLGSWLNVRPGDGRLSCTPTVPANQYLASVAGYYTAPSSLHSDHNRTEDAGIPVNRSITRADRISDAIYEHFGSKSLAWGELLDPAA